MANLINKSILKLTAVVTVLVIVWISGVQSQVQEHSMFGLLQMVISSTLKNLPIKCHSPFMISKGLTSSAGVSDYYSKSTHDIDTKLVGWYFYNRDGVCKPLYKKTSIECNKGLPKSKYECDTNCVKPCYYEIKESNGKTLVNEGVYSYDEYCVGGIHPVVCDGNCPPKIPSVSCCEMNFNSTIKPLPIVDPCIDV